MRGLVEMFATRKCYRKEMQITTKSEFLAKFYVIENEVVTGWIGQKNRGLPKYEGSSGLVIENKGRKNGHLCSSGLVHENKRVIVFTRISY